MTEDTKIVVKKVVKQTAKATLFRAAKQLYKDPKLRARAASVISKQIHKSKGEK